MLTARGPSRGCVDEMRCTLQSSLTCAQSPGQLPTIFSKQIPHCSCQKFPVLGIGIISAFLQSSTTVPSSHTSFITMRSPSYIFTPPNAQVVWQTSCQLWPFTTFPRSATSLHLKESCQNSHSVWSARHYILVNLAN